MTSETFNFDEIDIPERTVTLGGHTYRVQELTKQVATAAQKLERKYADMDEESATGDQAAEMLIELSALRLEASNGGPDPTTTLKQMWRNGSTSLQRLRKLVEFVGQAEDPPA
jgi:hypothetical protein